MKLRIAEKIYIEEPTAAIKSWCAENLVLDNPDYFKKEQMGKWTGNTPKTIHLYERLGNVLALPFGCLRDIWKMVSGAPYELKIAPVRPVSYQSNINLYSYQEKAVADALKLKNGVLVMPCGSGKTQSGLEIIARVGGRALWLTHTQDLLNQSMARAKSVLSGAEFGTITGGKVNIATHITFATVQTMAKLNLAQYRDMWDVIIVDECQHCAGSPTRVTQFYNVVSNLSARYKIGLTATPERADGLEKSMFVLLGGIIHEVDKSEVEDTTCPIKVQQIETGWFPDCDCVLMGDGTIDYSKVVENMTQDEARFEVVSDFISNLDGKAIILANRVEYLQRLCKDYKDRQAGDAVCISGAGQSKAAKEERKRALTALESGEIDCIFATYQLAKEGLDVPSLRYVVFATPEKDKTTVIQSAGRGGRKSDGKDHGTVIDFVDDFGMYRGWAKKRLAYYRKIGAEVL